MINVAPLIEKVKMLPPMDQEQALRHMIANAFRQDMWLTSKYLLGYSDMRWSTHGELIQALESPSNRKLICFPRGGFKSSVAVVSYAFWRLIRNPNLRILVDTEIFGNSKNFLSELKGHMESPRVTEIFGEFKSEAKWTESAITIKQRTRVKKEASVTCGGVGTTKVGQHYDLIIGDDYNGNKNSDTPEKCQKVIDHYKYNLNILEPDGDYVIIGTRYSDADLIGWILRDQLDEPDLAEGKFNRGLLRRIQDGQD